MRNFVLRFGILGGCVSIVLGLTNWFFVAQRFGADASSVVGYLSIVIALMCVPLGIKYFRDKLNEGSVSFGESFKIGLGITLINSIVNFFYSAIFFVIQGEAFQEWREQTMTPAQLEELRTQMAGMPDFAATPWFQAFIVAVIIFLIGTIINLVSSLALRRTAGSSQHESA